MKKKSDIFVYGLIISAVIFFYIFLIYSFIKYGLILWNKNLSIMSYDNYALSGKILASVNNFLFNIFGDFSNEIASLFLLISGSFLLVGSVILIFVIFIKKKN